MFDFGGVIVDLDKERCINAFEKMGVSVHDALGQYVQSGVFSALESGEITAEEFCDALREMAGRQDIKDSRIIDAWDEFLVGIPPERLDCIASIKDKYHVFLLSNTNRIHWTLATNDFFLYHGRTVDFYFEKIFLSYKLGLLKPDKRIFEKAVKDAKIKPVETLYIDDSKENCDAAESVGMRVFYSQEPGDWMSLFNSEDK